MLFYLLIYIIIIYFCVGSVMAKIHLSDTGLFFHLKIK